MKTRNSGRGIAENPSSRFERFHSDWEPDFIQGQPEEFKERSQPKTRFIAVFPKSVVNSVHSPDLAMKFSLNPYQGCEHGCTYCYARDTHPYWGYSPGLDFENTILYKPTAPLLLHRELEKSGWRPEGIVLSGNTDCYQPAERRLRITRGCLEVLRAHRNPVGIITKNALIIRDIDLLEEFSGLGLVQVVISLTTRDEVLRRVMEPRTASYARRLETIRALSARGIPVSVLIAPIVPGLNSHEILPMAKEASDNGASSLSGALVRLNGSLEAVFSDWIRRVRPAEAERVLSLIRSCHDGKLGETRFGLRGRGSGPIATQIQQLLRVSRQKYFAGRNVPPLRKDLFIRLPDWTPGTNAPDHGQLRLFE